VPHCWLSGLGQATVSEDCVWSIHRCSTVLRTGGAQCAEDRLDLEKYLAQGEPTPRNLISLDGLFFEMSRRLQVVPPQKFNITCRQFFSVIKKFIDIKFFD